MVTTMEGSPITVTRKPLKAPQIIPDAKPNQNKSRCVDPQLNGGPHGG